MKHKKVCAVFISVLSACTLSLNLSVPAVAFETVTNNGITFTLLGGHLNNTSENMGFYVPTEAHWEAWGTHVLHATTRWGWTENVNIGWKSTSNDSYLEAKSATIVDYYAADGINAQTTFFTFANGNYTQVPYTQNWDYGYIEMNRYYLTDVGDTKRNTVMLHEFGHVLGLGDNNTVPRSIMCQEGAGRTATYLSLDDYYGIQHIYGNN